MHHTDEIDYAGIHANERAVQAKRQATAYPPVTIVLPDATDRYGHDAMYIHDAVITEPHRNENVTLDSSTTHGGHVYVIRVEADECVRPYIAALNAIGIVVTSRNGMQWHGYQTRPLPL